jgi:hypothetical protein
MLDPHKPVARAKLQLVAAGVLARVARSPRLVCRMQTSRMMQAQPTRR